MSAHLGEGFSPFPDGIASRDHAHGSHNTTSMNQCGIPSMSMAAPISSQEVMHLLGTASQQMLFQCSNPHCSRLYQENMILNMMLRARVNNESMLFINHLQARISELEGKLVTGRAISSEGHSEKARTLSPLSTPAPPPPLERKDFPNVRFWTVKEWNAYKATRQQNNETTRKLAFITASSGGPVTNEYLEQMSETARTLFNELHAHGLAPPTWKAKSLTASDFFSNHMVLKFPELRWCEGGSWKAEAFAVARYPDCSRKFFNSDDAGRTHKKRKTDKSPRPSKQKRPLSPDPNLANDDFRNDNKELFKSRRSSSLSPVVSDSSFSYTGLHGLPSTNIVQQDLPSSSAKRNSTVPNSTPLQTSIALRSENAAEPIAMLQFPLSSPPPSPTQHSNPSECPQIESANTSSSNNTRESRSPTTDASGDQCHSGHILEIQDARAPSETAPQSMIVGATVGGLQH